MGAISYDVQKKERDFHNLTLSDENVIKYLILFRSKVDISYGSFANININQAGDIFDFNQELIVLYVSLDELIDKCKFKEKNIKLLTLLYEGHTMQDVIAMKIGYTKSATYDLFDRMVAKIVKFNNSNWRNSMVMSGYIETKKDE